RGVRLMDWSWCGLCHDAVVLVISALLATSGSSQGAFSVNAAWEDNGWSRPVNLLNGSRPKRFRVSSRLGGAPWISTAQGLRRCRFGGRGFDGRRDFAQGRKTPWGASRAATLGDRKGP